jgi:hypothetical protein
MHNELVAGTKRQTGLDDESHETTMIFFLYDQKQNNYQQSLMKSKRHLSCTQI